MFILRFSGVILKSARACVRLCIEAKCQSFPNKTTKRLMGKGWIMKEELVVSAAKVLPPASALKCSQKTRSRLSYLKPSLDARRAALLMSDQGS